MTTTTLLKAAGLLLALPLAMLPLKASAYDYCPPAYGHSYSQGSHSGRHAMIWPGDARRGAYYLGAHTRYVAQPVVLVRVQRVAPVAVYRTYPLYRSYARSSHAGHVVHRRSRY